MTRFTKASPTLLILLSVLLVAGCASMAKPPANVKEVSCTAKTITWDVAKEAEISNFACSLGKHEIDPALIFTMELKNVSDKPLRYRVNVFLEDMDKAFGALVPAKGKPPVVEPGKSQTVKLPFIKTDTMSNKVHVVVKTMSSD